MIERITPIYKFVCDRCGKQVLVHENERDPQHCISFTEASIFKTVRKEGQVCDACLKDFLELADNFFNEVNKNDETKI